MLISDLGPARPILIDTHIWVWASGGGASLSRFSTAAQQAIEHAARHGRLYASVTSVWEIALKAQKGELLVTGDLSAWLRRQRQPPGIRLIAMSAALAIEATTLPRWERSGDGREHKDPCDRFIVATARRRGAVLVTCDAIILDYARQGQLMAYDARV